MIETLTFRLADPDRVEEFLAADRRLQTEFAYQQPGLVRRTTARSDDGGWIVVTLWESSEAADAAAGAEARDPAARAFTDLLDPATVTRHRYTELD